MTDPELGAVLGPLVRDAAMRAHEQVAQGGSAVSWCAPAWDLLADAELPWVGAEEPMGGAGGDLADAFQLADLAGSSALPLPLVETCLASRLLAEAGIRVPRRPLTLAPATGRDHVALRRVSGRWQVDGQLRRVPWGSRADIVTVAATSGGEQFVVLVPHQAAPVRAGQNLAGEPRDDLDLSGLPLDSDSVAPLPQRMDRSTVQAAGALSRAVQMAGALREVTRLTVHYAGVREQFGRPIARFQAVAQNLAVLAQHSERAQLGVKVSAQLVAARGYDQVSVARAKVLAGEAADHVSAIAHQVHGAIGMTQEYPLGRYTTRLWSWAAEFGSVSFWAQVLGGHLVDGSGDQLWACATDGLTAADAPPKEVTR